MIANATTLILGAGASAECGYPTGNGLREAILKGKGLFNGQRQGFDRLINTFRISSVPSIDAFLAEPENEKFRDEGIYAIAAALLPCERERKDNPPPWVTLLFDAIRGRNSDVRSHKMKVVTFNYDLSLEYYLFHAFKATYGLDNIRTQLMLKESIEIIHVYGQLGQIRECGSDANHEYATQEYGFDEVTSSGKQIKIIGRKPDDPIFDKAHSAIRQADFIAFLGFGYDPTNIANLKLGELCSGRNVFTTGYEMGYGMRGWIKRCGIGPIVIGSANHTVSDFLRKSAFLNWANSPGMNSNDMIRAITKAKDDDNAEFHL